MTLELPKTYAAGFYKDIDDESYHSSAGVSSTTLKKYLDHAPNEVAHARLNPKEGNANLNLGKVFHGLVLEPDTVESTYVVMPEFNRRTKAGKAEAEAWEDENAGKIWISKDDLEQAKMMALSVEKHKFASTLLADTINESSIFWWYKKREDNDDRDYKQMCKVRPDAMSLAHPMLLDLKSTEDATFTGFQRSIVKFYYHLSAAMYLEGVNSCPQVKEETNWHYQHFILIATSKRPAFDPVTKKTVYNTAVYNLDKDALEMGRVLYRTAMRRLHDSKADESAYGIPDGIRDMSLTPWAKNITSI